MRVRFPPIYQQGTGQFIKACVIVVPIDDDTNLVEVEVLPDLKCIVGDIEPRVLSNLGASLYARQMAIHLNVSTSQLRLIQTNSTKLYESFN